MPPFTFIHAADLHLDSPFKGLQTVNPDIAQELQEATFKAFTNIVDLCFDRQVDFLLIAGDVFDGEDRSLRAQTRFRDGLARLADSDIPTYIVYGNHDPLDSWVTGLAWPEQVHFFGAGEVERVCYQRDGDELASLYGISYRQRDVGDNLAQGYRRDSDSAFTIGLLHANVGGDPGHEAYAPCSLEDLQAAGMDYWALGHIHQWNILQETEPTVVYAGNPQGRHPNEDGARGCLVVHVDDGGIPELEFVSTDTVRWVSGEVSIAEIDSEQELIDQLEEHCLELQEAAEGRALVCRLQLTGRGPLHGILRQRKAEEFTETLREQLSGLHPFVWVDRIEDQTSPDIDIEARLQGEDFIGDFLRIVRDYRSDPEKRVRLNAHLTALFSHRSGRKYLDMPDDDMLLELIEEAQNRCLDQMVEEED